MEVVRLLQAYACDWYHFCCTLLMPYLRGDVDRDGVMYAAVTGGHLLHFNGEGNKILVIGDDIYHWRLKEHQEFEESFKHESEKPKHTG